MENDDLGGNLPIERVDLCLGPQIEQPEIKHRLGLIADLLRIMQMLQTPLLTETRPDLDHVGNQFGIGGSGGTHLVMALWFNRAKGFDNQYGMRRDDEAATLTHDHRMLDLLGVADLHDIIDHIAGVFVQ